MDENGKTKAKITFLPENITIEVSKGTSILDAGLDHGVDIEHNCGGFCACSSCHIVVKKGMENLSDLTEDEEEQLDEAEGLTLESRLSCQSIINGDVVVEIPD